MSLRCYHHHLKVRALLCGFGGGCFPTRTPPSPSPWSPPLTHFIKHLLGSPAALSGTATGAACEPCSLTLHFLRNTCGLSEDEAAAAAARVRLRSTKKAHAIVALFRGIGFSAADIARLVTSNPSLLSYRADATLMPKIEFFRRELGLTDAEIRRLVLANPYRVLRYSLKRCIRPNYLILRDLLGSDKNVTAAVLQSTDLIHGDVRGILLPKIKILQDYGATNDVIVKLVTTHPRALMHRASRFEESLAAMKELGVRPSSGMFPYSFGLFARLHPRKWKGRMDNFLSLGWTKEQVIEAFVRHPYCMSVSNDKVKLIWQFLAKKLRWTTDYVARSPMVLSFSYDKRILPRCTVLNLLASRGIFNRDIKTSHLVLGEKKFKEKYVTPYQDEIPEVLEAYSSVAESRVPVYK
ncbi:transcription termination factor MTERF2, chloroplastic [Oryza sativa Japonica Group]|jgi:mTERF domain-containing protein|uniref:Os07g0423000 protein n=2 Tax=Oryza sativa subsp. japonica TaxID=39947 RepID=B9FWX0_ORYSJ|nr:uncharacterized protein LOC4343048 [Oryza sativa Japonica Group]KAB8105187.1 hypothetical protein EE612_038788 [Oryza sativa]EEE67057.1 hypothetical protein OsJ_24009 [Oryza sativa Japonica Group]KAF2922491.1 hypothetical protein DAI22_07g118300 [Oryza sativa Japonica Group]BAC84114.1 unknown protein [Oryza sativa Japonica Group]BAF21400.1 Os07g0423000 [Oryza sativa Japonica Group]|eukprot:NP_001059486.1 Os07g0423000 [Oryza sativa Japonica Group]